MSKFQKGKQFSEITIHGRRWFRRSAGNSYNTVSIYIDGTENGRQQFELSMTQGGGDYWQQRAIEWLSDNGWIICPAGTFSKIQYPLYTDRQALGIRCDVVEVTRKRDL